MRLYRCSAAFLLLVLVVAGWGLVAAGPPAETGKAASLQVIAPPNKAVLPSGEFFVICKGGRPDLVVDGASQPWGSFADPLEAARLRLEPGPHEIRIGTQKISVRVGGKDVPEGWQGYHLHPIAGGKGCTSCHQTRERAGQLVVEEPKTYTACLECHKLVEFEAKHSHPLNPLKHCGLCHHLHGSPRQGLLKGPVKKLCAECHDS